MNPSYKMANDIMIGISKLSKVSLALAITTVIGDFMNTFVKVRMLNRQADKIQIKQ